MKMPRIMLAAPASGSGKTLITCGILQALVNRGLKPAAFKCGPDYIDPMFHSRVMGISSKNLDTFFTDEAMTGYLFGKEAAKADISVLEGVMGFYDGVAGVSTQASAYDLARVTKTPVILVVDTKGMSLSIAAVLKGFLEYASDSRIKGVIFNKMSPGLYPRIKEQVEKTLPIRVLGYVPRVEEYVIESRHLGLVTPNEIGDLKEKLMGLSKVLEETLDIPALLTLAEEAQDFSYETPKLPQVKQQVTIGIARDEAFCFSYRDNLELMEELGARLVFFSPLRDGQLPKDLDGLIFYGGYPELYAKELSENTAMIREIREALHSGMPHLAECGGFMYLHETLEDMEKNQYPMVGTVPGKAFYTGKLGRFGYVTLEANKTQLLGEANSCCKGHEFHYFDSTSNGCDFLARKPLAKREWSCIHGDDSRAVGFPHLYYYSNPNMIYEFLCECEKRKGTC